MNFFDRQDESHRATRYLVLLFGLAFLAVALATAIVLIAVLGLSGSPDAWAVVTGRPEILAVVVAVVIGVMSLASLFRVATLARGGGHVARSLGATQIQSSDQDPTHRRLLNVVEEMAIASGVPVPEVYVLEQERGINAFAAGLTPADAAVAVTRGSLEQLNRAELQGVIAHEFSHILNGDMRLNLRLMGFSFGILVLTLVGRSVLRASGRGMRFSARRGRGAAAPFLIGLALVVVGGIGVVLSRLIKAAVSRRREVLADASAVQFTREPLALAGALKKIGGFTPFLETVETEEVSHMLFGRAGRSFTGLFATHPPLDQRIRALDPTFEPGDYVTPGSPPPASVADAAGVSALSGGVAAISVDSAGTIAPEAGRALRAAIPSDVIDAAHSSQSVWLLVLALGLARGGGSAAERRLVESRIGAERAARCFALREKIEQLNPGLRLPLFELAVPALRARPREQIEFLFELLEKLAAVDGELNLFEFLLQKLMRAYFDPPERPRRSPRERGTAMRTLIGVIAAEGNSDRAAAEAAYAAGLKTLESSDTAAAKALAAASSNDAPAPAATRTDFTSLDRALSALATAPAAERKQALTALAVTMRHDRRTTVAEAELFRAVAATLGCPVPPTGLLS
ncbi:MAG TPA: M48 family metallopeptidase [Gammaproteobacteria bacterium]|nr:M48 family metallopeptidase [Gammaproteobacteria bacterium]